MNKVRNIVLFGIIITSLLAGCKSSTNDGDGSGYGLSFSRNSLLLGQPSSPQGNSGNTGGPVGNGPSIQAMGDWESSGGDGVVCGVGDSKTLEILDEWEFLSKSVVYETQYDFGSYFNQEKLTPFEFTKGMNSSEILDFVFARLWKLTPLFGERLLDLKASFPASGWIATEENIEVDDSDPIESLPQDCKLVQIANRKTLSVDGKVPETKIFFNSELYSQLSEIQKAMLITHEYIYLLAKEGGHPTSDSIRKLIAFVFSKEFHSVDMASESTYASPYFAMSFRQVLDPAFGDYMRFFLNEKSYSTDQSDNPVYKGTIELMNFFRAKMNTCLGKNFDSLPPSSEKRELRKGCQRESFNDPGVYQSLSPEANFVYVTRFVDDRSWLQRSWNSEVLSLPKKNMGEKFDFDWQKLVGRSCDHMDQNTDFSFIEHQERAKLFCRNLEIDVSLLSEREITRYYSCVDRPLMFHSGQWNSMWVHHSIDPNTGAADGFEFSEAFEVIDEKVVETWREYAYNNRQFVADLVLQFKLKSDADFSNLKFLIENNPEIIEKVLDAQGGIIDSNQWQGITSVDQSSELHIKTQCFVDELTANKESTYIR